MKIILNLLMLTLLSLSTALAQTPTNASTTLDTIKKNQKVTCMINVNGNGFAFVGQDGKYRGLQIDFCRALAASVLNDSEKYATVPTFAKDQMVTLLSMNVDVMIRTFQQTFYREATMPIIYTNAFFYDGQAFAVKKRLGIKKKEDLNGVTVCIQQGSLTEQGTANWFRKHNMKYTQVTFGDSDTTLQAFKSDRCDVFTLDKSYIIAEMKRGGITDYDILPFDISRTVYSIVVRRDDEKWALMVEGIINALMYAEEFGITQANVDQLKATSQDPNVRRLLGVEGDLHTKLGLDPDWAVRAIKAAGNYGEIYDRWMVPYSGIERDQNKLCTDGGLLCPVPMQ